MRQTGGVFVRVVGEQYNIIELKCDITFLLLFLSPCCYYALSVEFVQLFIKNVVVHAEHLSFFCAADFNLPLNCEAVISWCYNVIRYETVKIISLHHVRLVTLRQNSPSDPLLLLSVSVRTVFVFIWAAFVLLSVCESLMVFVLSIFFSTAKLDCRRRRRKRRKGGGGVSEQLSAEAPFSFQHSQALLTSINIIKIQDWHLWILIKCNLELLSDMRFICLPL